MSNKLLDSLRKNIIFKCTLLFLLFVFINNALGYDFKFIYITSVVMFLLYVKPRTYVFFILFFTIIACVYLPIGLVYGSPNYSTIAALYYTDRQEIFEFISSLEIKHLFYSAALLVFGCFVCLIQPLPLKKYKRIVITLTLILMFFTPVKYMFSGKSEKFFSSGIPETRFFTELIYSVYLLNEELNTYTKASTFSEPLVNSKYNIYVLVIGESVRRDFMGTYNFEIDNSPFMDRSNGTLFTNYISAASTTQPSLTRSLSLYPNLSNNVVTLAKKAGFETFWLSNQGFVGEFDGSTAAIGRLADHSFFIKRGHSDDVSKFSDSELLPELKLALKSPKDKKLIILHLMGSHRPACARTDGQYDVFYLSENLSCYVQSIKNTDSLLAEIHNELMKTGSSWSMMYFADHGTSGDRKNLYHGDSIKEDFEVPLFITSSDSSNRDLITERRSGFYFMELFSQWVGISEPNIEKSCEMISNVKCENQNNVMKFNQQIIDFDSLKSLEIN